MAAASWEDVRDVLVRAGFGSPRPAASSSSSERHRHEQADPFINPPITPSSADMRTRAGDTSRARRIRRREQQAQGSVSPGPVNDVEGAAGPPVPSSVSRRSAEGGGDCSGRRSRRSVRSSNKRLGVRPVHQPSSELMLDLSPLPHAPRSMTRPLRAKGEVETESEINADLNTYSADESTSTRIEQDLLAAQRRSSALTASIPPSEAGSLTAYQSEVDLHEVQMLIESIQRNLETDLKDLSLSFDDRKGEVGDDDNDDGDDFGSAGGDDDVGNDLGSADGSNKSFSSIKVAGNSDVTTQRNAFTDVDAVGDAEAGVPVENISIEMKSKTSSILATRYESSSSNEKTKQKCCCECHCHVTDKDDKGDSAGLDGPVLVSPSLDTSIRDILHTANTIKNRREVEYVLSDVISDIEWAQSLSDDMKHRAEVSRLQRELQFAHRAISEMRIAERHEVERRKALGDELLVELIRLSSDLGTIRQFRDERDEMEKEVKDLRRQLLGSLEKVKKVEIERDDALAAALRDRTLVEMEQIKAAGRERMSLKEDGSLDVVPKQTDVCETTKGVNSTDFGVVFDDDCKTTHETKSTEQSIVDNSEQETSRSPLLLLPQRPLVALFSYLDPEQVLAVAEVSILMYSRVDSLFGLGSGETPDNDGEVGETPESIRRTEGDVTVPPLPPHSSNADEGAGPTAPKTATAATAAASAAASVAVSAAHAGSTALNRLWQQRAKRGVVVPSKASPPQPPVKPDIDKNSRVASEQNSAIAAATASDAAKDAASPLHTTDALPSPLLTATVASKMASKLSPQELSVIISMRRQIKELTDELERRKERQEDLLAELRGIEGVKDFLVSKLREVEHSKRAREEDEDRTARQVASDQEVISYLDCRLQELEQTYEKLLNEWGTLDNEVKELRKYGHIKTEFLEDMLQFEREQSSDSAKKFKAEKKLLVKEVKHCRQQLAALKAEKDGLLRQIARWKGADDLSEIL